MTARDVVRRFLPPLVLIVIGIVVAALAGGSVPVLAAGLTLGGIGSVWAVSAAFYEIGKSEDRDRARGRT